MAAKISIANPFRAPLWRQSLGIPSLKYSRYHGSLRRKKL